MGFEKKDSSRETPLKTPKKEEGFKYIPPDIRADVDQRYEKKENIVMSNSCVKRTIESDRVKEGAPEKFVKAREVQEKDYSSEVLSKKGIVAVSFYKPTSSNTSQFFFEEAAKAYENSIYFTKCSDEKVMQSQGINNLPIVLIFKNGEVKTKTSGIKSKKDLGELFESAIKN